jgi:4-alpha-glucanotransferase
VSDGTPSALRALAEHAGVVSEYEAMGGAVCRATDATRERLLAALGYEVADDAAAARALDEARAADAARPVRPARVAAAGDALRVPLALGADLAGAEVAWHVAFAGEDGAAHEAEGRALLDAGGCATADATAGATAGAGLAPLGYHRLRVTVRGAAGHRHLGERAAEQALVVAPARCADPAVLLGGQRAAGITANLYAVRGRRNWGAGDLTDFRALADLAARHGASFVGVNPLHALRTRGDEPSPYSPVSRRYRHLLYLDVDAVPELAGCPEAHALMADPAHAAEVVRLRALDRVDYPGVLAAKRPVLEALHRAFRGRRRTAAGDARSGAYEAFVGREGPALDRFAVFAALDEHFRDRGLGWWPEWPPEYQRPDGAGVAAFSAAHAERVDFHRWAQFELDAQLAGAAAHARAAGLAVGLYQDLAVGASPAGADAWGDPALYVRGASIGAPPDPLGPDGQNWGLPPWNPRVLAERGYRDWAELARAGMAHAGALRIDHVLGLFRQFWIPGGATAADGAYVRFPADDLLGVLALESVRANGGAGALVVGEDLGTVPPEVPGALARRGVLSSKVVYFERGAGGAFTPPRAYPRAALATVNTHDLAPLAGWWAGRDVELRAEVGQLDEAGAEAARGERGRDRAALVRMLTEEGVLDPAAVRAPAGGAGDEPLEGALLGTDALGPDALDELVVRAAVHAALRRAPSWLAGLALEDLVGEPEPVNMPGVAGDRFASWTRRLRVAVEDLAADAGVARAFGAERVQPAVRRP